MTVRVRIHGWTMRDMWHWIRWLVSAVIMIVISVSFHTHQRLITDRKRGLIGKHIGLVFMSCNKIKKPVFTKEQIAECEKCRHASKRKTWCCNPLIGCSIIEAGKVLTPQKKKILLPNRKVKYPSIGSMGKSLIKGVAKHARSGFKNRSEAEQRRCQEICLKCDDYDLTSRLGPRCKVCGCNMKVKTRWASANCPKNKW